MTSSTKTLDSLPFDSPNVRRYLARVNKAGRVAAYTDAILIVLAARDLDVTDALCERIAKYTSLRQLATWVKRAATVEKASDIFG